MRITFLLFILVQVLLPGLLNAQDQHDYTWLLGTPPNLPEKFSGGEMNLNKSTICCLLQ